MKKFNWIFKHLFLALTILVAFILLSSLALKFITRHNQELEVPDFKGLSIEEANQLAKENHLRIDIIDSLFLPTLKRGEIFRQNPQSGTKVKRNRRILITINSLQPKKVGMPQVVGYSLRQAKAELANRQLKVGSLIYVTDIANNNVVGQLYRGRAISPGVEIEIESEIDLRVGISSEGFKTSIPSLVGFDYETAKEILIDNSLNIGRVRYGREVKTLADSLAATVTSQTPAPSENLLSTPGSKVDIRLNIAQREE